LICKSSISESSMFMKKLKLFFVFAVFVLSIFNAGAQILNPVKWSYEVKPLENNPAEIILKAKIDEGWNLYAMEVPTGGPLPTEIKFTAARSYKTQGKIITTPKPTEVYDEMFEMKIGKWKKNVSFMQKIIVSGNKDFTINVDIEYMVCNDNSCIPLSENLKIKVEVSKFKMSENNTVPDTTAANTPVIDSSAKTNDSLKTDTASVIQTSEKEKQDGKSIWLIFLFGLGAGFLALLTPCVWPVIPMTVSFFLNKTQSRRSAIRESIIYGLTIIVVYVALGLAISLIFGPDALGKLATSPVFNLFFFALMIVFAIAFFGVFELTLPSRWTSALDKKSEQSGGLIGVFFMGITLVLVSFSCTGPILGALLVETASSANFLSPLMGMLGFSIAMAIPFMLLAVFPSWLKSMPKSGGWMNSVKVVLAFLMLAFSLKFFVTADTVAGWHIMSRELFLAIWITIFVMMGFYLLGKIKMAHDSELKHIGVFRLFLAMTSFVIALILIPGLWGAPLKSISGFMPSITTQSFNLNKQAVAVSDNTDKSLYKDYNTKEGAYGLVHFLDYRQGIEFAKKQNKPVLLDFSGLGCTNCKKMEASVWGEDKVLPLLKKEYVIITLYTDDREELPESEKYVSVVSGKERSIKTYGQKWSDMQAEYYGVNAQPYYVLLDPFTEIKDKNMVNTAKLSEPSAYDADVENYAAFLQKGVDEFKKRHL